MPCCEKAKWKREEIADHKFDYIDVDDFIEDSLWRKIAYAGVFLLTLKSIVVYMNDILIASLIIQNISTKSCDNNNNSFSLNSCGRDSDLKKFLPQTIRPYLIISSVLISFILLFIDWRKAQIIIKSRDISYSFTSPIAYRYYVLRSYAHYCLFCQIQNSRRTIDILAFFVFFQFKGWKRLLFAEFPRQLIITVNLVDFLIKFKEETGERALLQLLGAFLTNPKTDAVARLLLYLSLLSILIFAISFFSLVTAFFIYIPLLCVIRGNLKEYCCHKIDKRIGELLRKKSRKRTEEARRAELAEIERAQIMRRRGAGSAVDGQSDSTSEYGDNRNVAAPLGLTQRPTLPDIDVDLDAPVMKGSTIGTSGGDGYAKSEFGGSTVYAPNNYGGPRYGGYAPPMPQPSGFSDTSSDYGGAPYRGGPPPSGPGPNRQPYNPTPMQGGYRPHNPQWGYGAPNMPYGQGAPLPPPMRSTSPNFSEFAQGAPPMSNRAYQGPPQGAPRAMTPQGAPPQGAPPQMRYAGSEAGSDHGDQWGGSQGGYGGYRGGSAQGGGGQARAPPQSNRERY